MANETTFTQRTLMAMAEEIEQAAEALRNARVLFEGLAKEHGVPVTPSD